MILSFVADLIEGGEKFNHNYVAFSANITLTTKIMLCRCLLKKRMLKEGKFRRRRLFTTNQN